MTTKKKNFIFEKLISLKRKKIQEHTSQNIIGFLDECETGLVKGWVINNNIDDPLEVEIWINKELAVKVTADIYREDLIQNHFKDGFHGFEWRPPKELFIKEIEYSVNVVEPISGYKLKGSPKIIKKNTINKMEYNDVNSWFKKIGIEYKYSMQLQNELNLIKELKYQDQEQIVSQIIQSNLFDYGYYSKQIGVCLGILDALEHFMSSGASQGYKPMLNFEYTDYKYINKELGELTPFACFVHYVLSGRKNKLYFNINILKNDSHELKYLDADKEKYLSISGYMQELNPYEYYLAIGWRKKIPAFSDFDCDLYLNCYTDAVLSDKPPFLHYLKNGSNRISSTAEANKVISLIKDTQNFDSIFYKTHYGKYIQGEIASQLHYYCEGEDLNFNPSSKIDIEFYKKTYPDVKNNYLLHYSNFGKKEGRTSKFIDKNYIENGDYAWDFSKPTVLIACHDVSLTGAPILGLKLAQYLIKHLNIILWINCNKKNGLYNEFKLTSTLVVSGNLTSIENIYVIRMLKNSYGLNCAILNSAMTSDVAVALFSEHVATVALIHEFTDYAASNILQMMIHANRIIFPAQIVKNSADKLAIKSFGMKLTSSVVRHQGDCHILLGEYDKVYTKEEILSTIAISGNDIKPIIIMGCGFVQMRKGVELFIETARICKKILNNPFRFIWVGDGYNPETDLHYSTWIKSQIILSELEHEVFFFNGNTDLTPFFDIADLFFLSSRLDPFPNVAIDSVLAGVPVIAFENATGFVDYILHNPGSGYVAPYLDVSFVANIIKEYINTGNQYEKDNITNNESLSFSKYAEFIWDECQFALDLQKKIEVEAELLSDLNIMNGDFYSSAYYNFKLQNKAEYHYVSMWSRGIKVAKSRIGFNDIVEEINISNINHTSSDSITPLLECIKQFKPINTHNVVKLNSLMLSKEFNHSASLGIHIHVYFTDDLVKLLNLIRLIKSKFTLCFTTDTEEKSILIANLIKKYNWDFKIIIMENRGRDIGPFIMAMKKYLHNFDIVGHFHLKGTKQLEKEMVYQWQEFLYYTLIGKEGEVANNIINIFEQNSKLGLCFQEDPCIPNWGENKALAQQLLDQFGITIESLDLKEYPTGNMFWARTAAIAPLWLHDWKLSDFTAEPVPYDGTILHALERLTPLICEYAGYEWATLHNPTAVRYSLRD